MKRISKKRKTYLSQNPLLLGYPLDVLLKVAEHQHAKGQPLDIVLSYCHYTLQNTLFADYAPKFKAAGVRYLMNASPLCMALLRDEKTPEWHPAYPAKV